jgi:DNA polymerase family B, exonuclease domain
MDVLTSEESTEEHQADSLNEALTQIFPGICGDEVTFIGSTFLRYGDAAPYRQHCLVVNSCDEVDGVEIHSHGSERGILEAWTQLINDENPDIIVGYNIFGLRQFGFGDGQQQRRRGEVERRFREAVLENTNDGRIIFWTDNLSSSPSPSSRRRCASSSSLSSFLLSSASSSSRLSDGNV